MMQLTESGRSQTATLQAPTQRTLDRRRENRRSANVKAVLTVLDGPLEGNRFEVLTRDVSCSGLSFLFSHSLSIGQTCRMDVPHAGGLSSWLCEVVRSRALTGGRHEMAVQYRKPV